MRTAALGRGIVFLILSIALGGVMPCGPTGPKSSGGGPGGGMGPPPMGPRPTGLDPVPPLVLECRTGPEPSWQASLGSAPGVNGCTGSMLLRFGPVEIETGVAGGQVSAVLGAPTIPSVPKECGPGCALAMEETLVFVPDQGLVAVLKGHNQTRFGWSTTSNAWVPEPYLYVDLIGYEDVAGKLSPVENATSPHDFDGVEVWVIWNRDGGHSIFKKSGDVFKIAERNDALAAMDKRASTVQPAPMFLRGRTVEYVRGSPGDYLKEVRDHRFKAGITAVVIRRHEGDPALDPDFGRVEKIAYDATTVMGGATQANAWFEFTYDSAGRLNTVAVDANDPTGMVVRSPTVLSYDGTSSRVSQVVDPSGDIKQYTYQGGRVVKILHVAQSPSENEWLAFDYQCGGAWCPDGTAPFRFTETDEDGFVRRTEFSPFPDGSPLAVYVSQIDVGTSAAGAVTMDESSVERYVRDGTGTLRVHHQVADGVVESWNTDGRPPNGCSAHRIDRNVDPADAEFVNAAVNGALPEKSVSQVDYEVRCYDDDNMLVSELSPSGGRRITYQKEAHPDPEDTWWNVYGWAAQLPSLVQSGGKNAVGGGESATSTILIATAGAAQAEIDAGSPCWSEIGEASGGPAVPALSGAAFFVCSTSPLSGGPEIAILDERLRLVASNTAQDIAFKTRSYDPYGHEVLATDPTAARSIARTYSPVGKLLDEKVSICGTVVAHRTVDQQPGQEVTTETIGSSLTTQTRLTLDPGTGRADRSEYITPAYTKTVDVQYSQTGDVMTGYTSTYSETLAPGAPGTPEEYSREEWAWTVRGHR